jgi:hypothetical protein
MEQGDHCLEQKPAYFGADQSHVEAILKATFVEALIRLKESKEFPDSDNPIAWAKSKMVGKLIGNLVISGNYIIGIEESPPQIRKKISTKTCLK